MDESLEMRLRHALIEMRLRHAHAQFPLIDESPSALFLDAADSIGELVRLVGLLAPEKPINQDEQGGCVWCGGPGGYAYATADPADHDVDCPWLEARQLLTKGGYVLPTDRLLTPQ